MYIRLALPVSGDRVHADFAGTAGQVPGNLKRPWSRRRSSANHGSMNNVAMSAYTWDYETVGGA